MWIKLAHFVKPRANGVVSDRASDERLERPATPGVSSASSATNNPVMSRVYEQHPNLFMFHSASAVNLSSPSPPASPSKKGSKHSMFGRSLKAKLMSTPANRASSGAQADLLRPESPAWVSPSPVKLIPKKLRASLQVDTFTAQTTNVTAAPGSAPLPAHAHIRTPSRSDRKVVSMFLTPDATQGKEDNTAYFTPESGSGALPNPVKADIPTSASGHALPIPAQDLVVHSQEDLVASLHSQLELQRQLATQFEVDLTARDELVSLLSTQLQEAEAGIEKYKKEVERRQGAMHVLQWKVGELEKLCCGLEEEVEHSREESFERSVMDEASEGALVVLHSSIGHLKGELEKIKKEEAKLLQERDMLKIEVERLVGEQGSTRNEIIKFRADAIEKERIIVEERERYQLAESQWLQEKASLVTRLETRTSDEDAEVAKLRSKITEKEEEVQFLKVEVEAQWAFAEKTDESIKRLEGEKEAFAKSVEALHDKVEELGSDLKESELKRAELEHELSEVWANKVEIEHERDQLIQDVNLERNHVEQLTQSEQDHNVKFAQLELEHRYATDNVARLEELLCRRDEETAEAHARIIEREQEAEQLRDQMHKMKREHGRFIDEQGRTLDETIHMEEVSRHQMQDMVKQNAENEVMIGSMKERLGNLTNENERLRLQVHDLKQGSTDKDMKLLQFTKERAQDKEDKEGLNIALDSKQQELELLKRKLRVKGTGGSTPAPNRIGLSDLAPRRQSVAFVTPTAPRPKHSSSVSISKAATPATETPSKTGPGPSLHGNIVNSSAPPSASKLGRPGAMGPPGSRRSSGNATPSSASISSLSRSTSARPRSALPVSAHRRSSSVMSMVNTAQSEDGEKENIAPLKATTRTSMVPA